MLVRAISHGYYLYGRAPGEEFDVPDALYSATWMEKVGVPAAKAAAPELITVRATAAGQYINIRHPGDVFTIPKHLFEKTWMVLSEPEVAAPLTLEERLAVIEAKVLPKPVTPPTPTPVQKAPVPTPVPAPPVVAPSPILAIPPATAPIAGAPVRPGGAVK
jgi:hypothetical protein